MYDPRAFSLIVDNCAFMWPNLPAFARRCGIVQRDRVPIGGCLENAFGRYCGEVGLDRARVQIIQHAPYKPEVELKLEHFLLFKEFETIQVILEDSFGVAPGIEEDRILIAYQQEALRILMRGVFGPTKIDIKELVCFLGFLMGIEETHFHVQDKIMRYKSMLWFAYLLIDLMQTDGPTICQNGITYLRSKLIDLLDRSIEGKIILWEEGCSYEGGRWDSTLFGWLQGEDRQAFAMKLRKQFNLDNQAEHTNRRLLPEHRKRMYEEAMSIFGG